MLPAQIEVKVLRFADQFPRLNTGASCSAQLCRLKKMLLNISIIYVYIQKPSEIHLFIKEVLSSSS